MEWAVILALACPVVMCGGMLLLMMRGTRRRRNGE
jgi:hypothetical protein